MRRHFRAGQLDRVVVAVDVVVVAVGVEHPLDAVSLRFGAGDQFFWLEAGVDQRRDARFLAAEQVGEVRHRPDPKLLYDGHWNTPSARWKMR